MPLLRENVFKDGDGDGDEILSTKFVFPTNSSQRGGATIIIVGYR